MREIKFRAWGVVSGKMYDWETILGDKMLLSSIGLPLDECRLIWLQYTGLEDKNGKEIYEGDIVIDYTDITDGQRKWQIVWECAAFEMQTQFLMRILRMGEDLKVLGNIHENPELLEGLK